jgi:DNA-binding IclR family transcriptional regulator
MSRYPTRKPIRSSAAAGGVAAVDRALLLLTAFRPGERALSLSELVERTKLVTSTALRLLASLVHFELVQRLDDGRYGLGLTIARLYSAYTGSFSLEKEVLPVLTALVRRTGESAAFHVRQGNQRLVLYRVDSPQSLRDHVKAGDLIPLDRGTGGRVLLAYSGAKGTIYDRIRKDGFADLVGDREPELAGISAPVFGSGGVLAGALTLTMPTHRHKKAHVAPVREAARALSQRLSR